MADEPPVTIETVMKELRRVLALTPSFCREMMDFLDNEEPWHVAQSVASDFDGEADGGIGIARWSLQVALPPDVKVAAMALNDAFIAVVAFREAAEAHNQDEVVSRTKGHLAPIQTVVAHVSRFMIAMSGL